MNVVSKTDMKRGWRCLWALLSTLMIVCAAASAGLAQAAPQGPTGATPWSPPSPAWRVYLKDDGLYKLDYDYLATAGLPVVR